MKLSPVKGVRPITWFHPVGRQYLVRFFIIIIILVLSIRAAIFR